MKYAGKQLPIADMMKMRQMLTDQIKTIDEIIGMQFDCSKCHDEGKVSGTRLTDAGRERFGCTQCGLLPGEHA